MRSAFARLPRLRLCIRLRNQALCGAGKMLNTPKGLSDEKAARIMASKLPVENRDWSNRRRPLWI